MLRWLKNRRRRREIVRLRLAVGTATTMAGKLASAIDAACKGGEDFCKYADALRYAAGVLKSTEINLTLRLEAMSGRAPAEPKENRPWILQTKPQRPTNAT